MNRVTHFDLTAEKPKRAEKFYEKVFGWKFEKWKGPMDYWMIKTGIETDIPGINGGMAFRNESMPDMNHPVFTITVMSFDDSAKKIIKNGGVQIMKKQAIPGIGWHGQFRDTEGNLFGIMETDKSASFN